MNSHLILPNLQKDTSQYIINIDESVANTTYFGWAIPGVSGSSAKWKIIKMTVSSGITSFRKADGNDLFDNIWDNRNSLTYL